MKICIAIAGFLATSATSGWSVPNIEWTTLRVDHEKNQAFCALEATRLQDLQLDEPGNAYAVFYVDKTLSWIVPLGKLAVEAETVGTVTYAPYTEVQAWDYAEIVICPIEDTGWIYETINLPEKYRMPIPRPRPRTRFNMRTPNPHWRGEAEAQDAEHWPSTHDIA